MQSRKPSQFSVTLQRPFPNRANNNLAVALLQRRFQRTIPPEGLLCKYSFRPCTQNRLDGYDFCIRHILEDKSAPFKQCNFTSAKTNRRCMKAVPKTDRKAGYCCEHIQMIQLSNKKAKIQKKSSKKKIVKKAVGPKLLAELARHSVNPGELAKTMDLTQSLESFPNSEFANLQRRMQMSPRLMKACRSMSDSDEDSVDDQDDPLKYAGIYTPEEVASIARDKLTRLQSLYIDQFKRLQHVLKEKRRDYLIAKEQERQQGMAPLTKEKAFRTNHVVREEYRSLKRYHNYCGGNRKKRRLQRAHASAEPMDKEQLHSCNFEVEKEQKCCQSALPKTSYCRDHILQDEKQNLYQACGVVTSNLSAPCKRPIIFGPCYLHITVDPVPDVALVGPVCDDSQQAQENGVYNDRVDGTKIQNVVASHSSTQLPVKPGTTVVSASAVPAVISLNIQADNVNSEGNGHKISHIAKSSSAVCPNNGCNQQTVANDIKTDKQPAGLLKEKVTPEGGIPSSTPGNSTNANRSASVRKLRRDLITLIQSRFRQQSKNSPKLQSNLDSSRKLGNVVDGVGKNKSSDACLQSNNTEWQALTHIPDGSIIISTALQGGGPSTDIQDISGMATQTDLPEVAVPRPGGFKIEMNKEWRNGKTKKGGTRSPKQVSRTGEPRELSCLSIGDSVVLGVAGHARPMASSNQAEKKKARMQKRFLTSHQQLQDQRGKSAEEMASGGQSLAQPPQPPRHQLSNIVTACPPCQTNTAQRNANMTVTGSLQSGDIDLKNLSNI